MAEDYQVFLDYDWSDQRWQDYLGNLYPTPSGKSLVKFKKKWYKKNVDANFDDTYEPPCAEPQEPVPPPAAPSGGSSGYSGGPSGAPSAAGEQGLNFPSASYTDGTRWAVMGHKSTICFVVYAMSLSLTIGSFAFVFPPYQSLLIMVSAFILEILANYGLKLSADYMHAVLLDDIGAMPIMNLTLLTPGLHPVLRTLALLPSFVSALMSFSQICKYHEKIPMPIRDFFAPLAEPKARFQIMKVRAHVEVALGISLVTGIFIALAAPFSAILFWNFMVMRYMMSSWTQLAFRSIDSTLNPTLSKIPGVKQLYGALKRSLYSFVDPDSKKSGRLCTIL